MDYTSVLVPKLSGYFYVPDKKIFALSKKLHPSNF